MSEAAERQLLHHATKFDLELVSRRDPKGTVRSREVIRHPGAVVIVPVLEGAQIALIRNFRLALEKTIWELPAGTLEPPEPPNVCAARELIEEAGYQAGKIHLLGEFFTTPGMTDELMHAFAATDLRHVGQRLEEGEEIEVRVLTQTEALEMVDSGELNDAKSMLALLLAERQGLIRRSSPSVRPPSPSSTPRAEGARR